MKVLKQMEVIAQYFERLKLSFSLSKFEFSLKYRRYTIGPLWLTITMCFYTTVVSLVYSKLFGLDNYDFIAYIVTGLVFWFFINATILDCSMSLVSNEGLIKNYPIDVRNYSLIAVFKNAIVLLYYIPVVVIALLFRGFPSFSELILSLLGLGLVILNLMFIGLLLSLLVARFRDFEHLLSSIMQITFLLTPILWEKAFIGDYYWIADLNIFFHFIEVVRAPLIGESFAFFSYLFLVLNAIIGWLLCSLIFTRLKDRIVFWL